MRNWFREQCELWQLLSSVAMTGIIALALVVMVLQCLRPSDPSDGLPVPNRVNEDLRERLRVTEQQYRQELDAHTQTKLELDTLRRGAVWVPGKPDVDAADLIPKQNLTIPEARP